MIRIEHVALYVADLEAARAFFVRYFDAKSNDGYFNPKTGLRTFFLSFDGECRLEIMSRSDSAAREPVDANVPFFGFEHLAFSVGTRERVDATTRRLAADGFRVVGAPRTTGDGYYESRILDSEGNRIEIVANR